MSSSKFNLKGKTALITGASAGLGAHFAQTLQQAGAKVILCARRTEKLQTLAAEIEKSGGEAVVVPLDVSQPDSITHLGQIIEEQKLKIDFVVNNAGTIIPKPAMSYTANDWDQLMDVNLRGVWLMCQMMINHMKQNNIQGSFINISSVMDTCTRPQGSHAYNASKAAVSHLTRSLALEFASSGIRINAISPGWYVTDLNRQFLQSEGGEYIRSRIPMQRYGEYAELDGALLLLASDASSYITGSTIYVDGGISCHSL